MYRRPYCVSVAGFIFKTGTNSIDEGGTEVLRGRPRGRPAAPAGTEERGGGAVKEDLRPFLGGTEEEEALGTCLT